MKLICTKYKYSNTLDSNVTEFGMPNIMYFGDHGGYKVLVIKMLGPTIQDYKINAQQNKLTGKTILKIAIQAVSIFKLIQ